jgi:hypothetical protein
MSHYSICREEYPLDCLDNIIASGPFDAACTLSKPRVPPELQPLPDAVAQPH